MMKPTLAILAAAALLAAGCTPIDQAPPQAATPTPVPAEEGTIAEMDFESGEVTDNEASEPPGTESTPEPQ